MNIEYDDDDFLLFVVVYSNEWYLLNKKKEVFCWCVQSYTDNDFVFLVFVQLIEIKRRFFVVRCCVLQGVPGTYLIRSVVGVCSHTRTTLFSLY